MTASKYLAVTARIRASDPATRADHEAFTSVERIGGHAAGNVCSSVVPTDDIRSVKKPEGGTNLVTPFGLFTERISLISELPPT